MSPCSPGICLVALLAVSLLTAVLCAPLVAKAAESVPTGKQEYFILGYEQHTWLMMDKVQDGEGGAQFADGMNSVVTATASADNQIIYYDHWEDGLEADIFNPVQLSTLIIGDGNAANGDACDFNNDACGPDVLLRGDFVNFGSDQGLSAGCTVPSAQPATYTELCSSVPVRDRCAIPGACTNAEVHFDGGDYLVTSGGPISIIHSEYPLTQFIGGSTEMLSRQAVEAARSYSVPVGEDLYPAFGCPNCVMEPFHYVDLNLVAFDDNTNITVTSPGVGTINFTLNRGEHWTSLGFIDDGPEIASLKIQINSGTKVSTTGPIAGLLFTGGDATWATRHYALLPDILHSTDYITTAPGDDPAVGPSVTNRPMNLYILNPDPLSAINVTTTDSSGTNVINIPANSVVDYFTGTGRFPPSGSTVRLTSDRNFWGISAYDYNTNISDWGHSWLATKFLTGSYTVSFAPGNFDPTTNFVNLNGVFVSPTQDNTTVLADLDNDGDFDVVDTDGDGAGNNGAAHPLCDAATPNCLYTVNSLTSLRIFDHNDYDNTGTKLVTNKPVAVAWGQDTDLTGFGDAALDTGYTVYPINQLFLDPVLVVGKEADTATVGTAGGVVTYTVGIDTYNFGPLTNLTVYDLLPPGVAETQYIPGSTLITYPDLTTDTTDPATSPGRLDWTLSPDSLQMNQRITVQYSINIPPAPGGTPRLLTNEGHAQGNLGGSVYSPLATTDVVQTDIVVTKSVDNLSPGPGDVLTFTIGLTNNGILAETGVTLTDAIPPNATYCDSTTLPLGTCNDPTGPVPGSWDAGQNALVWNIPNLAVGGPNVFTFQAIVNPNAPASVEIPNRAGYESTQTPYFLSNEVVPVVVGPDFAVSKTGPSVLHPNEIASFEIVVENTGSGPATNVLIVDPFPLNTTYVTGSMEWRLNSAPFTPVTDAADADEGTSFVDRLELAVAGLGPGEDITFRFFVQVNAGTAGQFVNNQANVSATEVAPTDTNLVQIPIVGSSDVTGHVFLDDDGDGIPEATDGDGIQQVGEPDLANIDVVITSMPPTRYTCLPAIAIPDDGYDGSLGSMACCSITVPTGDFGPSPATTDLDFEVAVGGHGNIGDLTVKVIDPFGSTIAVLNRPGSGVADDGTDAPAGDTSNWAGDIIAFDDDGGDPSAETMGSTIGGGGNVCSGDGICSYTPAPDTAGGLANLAGFDGVDPRGAWTVCIGDSTPGSAGTFDSASLLLTSTDSASVTQVVTTDANGDYSVTVNGTNVTADVDETDADFPPGALLTTGNDPQGTTTVPNGTVALPDVGYQPLPITFAKDSDPPGHVVIEGDTITYTITATNTTAVTQTGVDIDDALPAGTSWVPGSTTVTQPVFRVDEYFIVSTDYSGNTYDLTLNQDLAPDYFVIVQGSDGDGSGANDRGPDENYASLTQDPFGTGELGVSAASDVIRLERTGSVNGWQGVVTVVECLQDCAAGGFVLRDVRRVDHAGASTSGAEATVSPWTDINQTMLLGGFNGAGCDTVAVASIDTKSCHTRIYPSNPDQINWTRDGVGATLSAATSTVMVVEWGSDWNVQRVRVQGNNGGDGADAVGEYNTAAINPVARANTWVWGTGHTNDQGIGDAAEAVLLTLGDGVNQNATESLVAAGIEYNANAVDFEVYALTHPDAAVDQLFKVDGDTGALTVDVAVASVGLERMAISYNGQNGIGNAFPRPMFSARYTSATNVRLERRRSGQNFPAWVQGIDLSAIEAVVTPGSGGAPPNLAIPADGIIIPPGWTLTLTFQVVVDDPLAGAITQITNAATLNTAQEGPFNDSVVDDVARPDVAVEPNNSGVTTENSTITYTHTVTNTGDVTDSYNITIWSELGYRVELIDPATDTVIATDSDGDQVWDAFQTVNSGSLGPGGSADYKVRITIPPGTPAGTQETTRIFGASDGFGGISSFATDETLIIDAADVGPVILVPDNSGIAAPGSTIAYTHFLTNNTGATDTFDLTVFNSPTWTATFYNDSNSDGTYTAGIDVAITNSKILADGETQILFMVIDVPAGATVGTVDIANLLAVSQADVDLFDVAADTTTVFGGPVLNMDLSGGGSHVVDPGDTDVFPGTLSNTGAVTDRYDLTVTGSEYGPGGYSPDGKVHTTQLWIDTGVDGIPDLQIAVDTDGDGTWDTIEPGYDTDFGGDPDVQLAAGASVAYELRRPVDLTQKPYRDPVTLAAVSQGNGDTRGVTATTIVLLPTRLLLGDFRAFSHGGEVVVEWTTLSEERTIGFFLLRGDGAGGYVPVNDTLLPGLITSPLGGTYRYIDRGARPGETHEYLLQEVEATGRLLDYGPFVVTPVDGSNDSPAPAAAPSFSSIRRSAVPLDLGRDELRRTAGASAAGNRARRIGKVLKVVVQEEGIYFIGAKDISRALGVSKNKVKYAIRSNLVRISNGRKTVGQVIVPDGSGLFFFGRGPNSLYTDENVYVLSLGTPKIMPAVTVGPASAGDGKQYMASVTAEENNTPLVALAEDPESDYWMWDYLFPGFGRDSVDLPVTTSAHGSARPAVLTVRTFGGNDTAAAMDHFAWVHLNGVLLGSMRWEGIGHHSASFEVSPGILQDGGDTVRITGIKGPNVPFSLIYINSVTIDYPRFYVAEGNSLLADGEGHGRISVRGFDRPAIHIVDITDPVRPRLLTGGTVSKAAPGDYRISFALPPGTERFMALTADAVRRLRPYADVPSSLASPANRGDYLVITAGDLVPAAGALAAYRSSQGLESMVVDLEDIYDEFSYGIKDPEAIRRFLAHALASWEVPPRYVLLAGEGSFDYRNHTGSGDSIIPALLTVTPNGLAVSDNLYADAVGDDWVPDVAIGRIPVVSPAELEAFTAKVMAYEATAGGWRDRAVTLADNPDAGGDFSVDVAALAEVFPPAVTVDTIFHEGQSSTLAGIAVSAALNDGRAHFSFLGHGGPDALGNNRIFAISDVLALANGPRLPIMTALTCIVGNFGLPGFDSLAEVMVMTPGKGAVAVWAPSGLAFNALSHLLGEEFYRSLFADSQQRLGDAIVKSLRKYAVTGEKRYLIDIYTLIGDPATRIR